MAITKNHAELGLVKKNGDVDILYLLNEARDVAVDRSQNNKIPSDVRNVQELANKVKDMAFSDGENLIYVSDETSEDTQLSPQSEINDVDEPSLTTTISSNKMYKTFTRFIDANSTTVTHVNRLFTSPVIFVIDNTNVNFKSLFPVSDTTIPGMWIVEYYPGTENRDVLEGNPGDPGTVKCAYQKWKLLRNDGSELSVLNNTSTTAFVRYYQQVTAKWSDFATDK